MRRPVSRGGAPGPVSPAPRPWMEPRLGAGPPAPAPPAPAWPSTARTSGRRCPPTSVAGPRAARRPPATVPRVRRAPRAPRPPPPRAPPPRARARRPDAAAPSSCYRRGTASGGRGRPPGPGRPRPPGRPETRPGLSGEGAGRGTVGSGESHEGRRGAGPINWTEPRLRRRRGSGRRLGVGGRHAPGGFWGGRAGATRDPGGGVECPELEGPSLWSGNRDKTKRRF